VSGQPNIFAVFEDRVRRLVSEGVHHYRDELRAVASETASKGLGNSGAHLRRRVEVLRKWTVTVTDHAFEAVTRLPGTQSMHREVLGDFLAEQLRSFLQQAEGDVLIFAPGPAATNAIKEMIGTIRDGLESDLREFQTGVWRPRSHGHAASVTHNTVNVHGSNVGAVQQAGQGSLQSAVVHFNLETVRTSLEEFAIALRDSNIPEQIKREAMIEVETIRPQLRKATPSIPIVQEGLHSLRNILEGVVAGVLANKLTALLIAAGIAIAS